MKLKTALPHTLVIPGEPDPIETPIKNEAALAIDRAFDHPRPEAKDDSDNRIPLGQVLERGQKFMERGLYARAIVAKPTDNPTDLLDPNNWGIIVSATFHLKQAFTVHWADGMRIRTNGDDLVVIYQGMNQKDMHAMFKNRVPLNAADKVVN